MNHTYIKNHSVRELGALYEIASVVSSSLEPDEIMNKALEKVLAVTGLDAGSIYLWNPDNLLLTLSAYRGVSEEFASGVKTFKPGQSLTGQAAALREPVVVHDLADDPRVTTHLISMGKFQSFIAIPICVRNLLIGVMNLVNRQHHIFGPEEIEFYTGIANTIGMALHNGILFLKAKKAAQSLSESEEKLRTLAAEQQKTIELLQCISQAETVQDLAEIVTTELKNWLDMQAVGIRLKSGNDYPYYETRGFPDSFVNTEMSLCARDIDDQLMRDELGNPVLMCMCGNVIFGRFDPALPFFTTGGSFWTNSTTDLLQTTTEADRQARTRNRCNGEGYESVALIPLRANRETFGLIQLNDFRKGRFSPELISLLERIANQLALALAERRSVEALHRSESLLNMSEELSRVGGWEWDVSKKTTFWTDQVYAIHGLMPGAIEPGSVEHIRQSLQSYRPEDRPEILKAFENCVEKGISYDLELPFTTATGDSIWVRTMARAEIRDGRVEKVVGNIMDITEQKRIDDTLLAVAESGLSPDEDLYRLLVRRLAETQQVHTVILSVIRADDPGTAHTLAVWSGGEFVGNFSYGLEGTPCENVTQQGACFYPQNIQTLFPDDHLLSQMQMESYWGVPLKDSSGNVLGILAVLNDRPMEKKPRTGSLLSSFASRIAVEMARRQAEDALKESEKRYRLLFQNLTIGFALHEMITDDLGRPCDYRFLEANPAFEKMTGLKAEDIIGHTVLEVLPETEPYWIDMYGRVVATRQSIHIEHYSREIGRYFDVTAYSPEPGRFATLFQDITERKLAGQEMKKLSEAVLQASDAVVITDVTGRITFANPAFERITGHSLSGVMGQTPRILKSGRQDDAFYTHLWNTILSGRRWAGRIMNKRKDATLFTAECSISPVRGEDGHIVNFVCIMRDISRELTLEKQNIQAQKMEAIGSLAGGIAHDFNNILFPIRGLTEMMLWDEPEGGPNHENLLKISGAAKRAGDLVKQILTFSRRSDTQKMPIRIQPVLKEVINLSRSTIPANIAITAHIQAGCGAVLADAIQLHQIAMNLITNAYHAVETGGGSIEIELTQTCLERADAKPLCLNAGDYARLCISDTGHGIDPAIMDNIFEPYFTTKSQGKGTGLGLSVVHGIVTDMDGAIQVESHPGKGTRFCIFLPLIPGDGREEKTPIDGTFTSGSERIMLIDDEEAILGMEKKILVRLGYRVTLQQDSMTALAEFSANPDQYDLIITDMAMPGLTGDELSKKMLAIRPDIPIILCTGFSEHINAERAKTIGIRGFAFKPLSSRELSELIRNVLGPCGNHPGHFFDI